MPKPRRRSSAKVRKPLRPCTYELGYVRQDLYACLKCTADANGVLSGFCAGCRQTCHADHPEAVIELYTKRAFRCDCGNTRDRLECFLCPHKDDLNVGNERTYSHNFEGRYCRCDREYDYRLEMAQCAMCEDWFHEECYRIDSADRAGADVLPPEYELICKDCVRSLPVLIEYYELYHGWGKKTPSSAPAIRGACIRPSNVDPIVKPGSFDLLWKPGFRLALCSCNLCMELYKAARAQYIVDRSDFVNPIQEDDSKVLRSTSDEEIVKDVLADQADPRDPMGVLSSDDEPIPRKRLPATANRPVSNGNLTPSEVIHVRRRINRFLRTNIESNGGNLDRDSVMSYLADLKTDMLSTYRQKMDIA